MRVRKRLSPEWCGTSFYSPPPKHPLRKLASNKNNELSGDIAILVGDVGGTHARFAIVDASARAPWRIRQRQDLEQDFPTFSTALRSYFERAQLTAIPASAVIAVAGPVTGGTAQFTNRGWQI